jgi:hypothetical protein
VVASADGKAQQARTLGLGQVHAEQHHVGSGNALNAQLSVLFLLAHRS